MRTALGYNGFREYQSVLKLPLEAGMPRFIGSKTHYIWWELLALAILVVVILIVVDVATDANIF